MGEWGKGEGVSWWKCQAAEVQNKSVSWQLCTFAFLSLYQVLWYSWIQSQQQLYVLLLKKYNWMQGKVNTQVNQKMESFLPRRFTSFHVKRCWKYHSCFLKLDSQGKGAAPVLMPAWHYCWIAWYASNNTSCWVLRLVLCIHLALSVSF